MKFFIDFEPIYGFNELSNVFDKLWDILFKGLLSYLVYEMNLERFFIGLNFYLCLRLER